MLVFSISLFLSPFSLLSLRLFAFSLPFLPFSLLSSPRPPLSLMLCKDICECTHICRKQYVCAFCSFSFCNFSYTLRLKGSNLIEDGPWLLLNLTWLWFANLVVGLLKVHMATEQRLAWLLLACLSEQVSE